MTAFVNSQKGYLNSVQNLKPILTNLKPLPYNEIPSITIKEHLEENVLQIERNVKSSISLVTQITEIINENLYHIERAENLVSGFCKNETKFYEDALRDYISSQRSYFKRRIGLKKA